MTAPTLSELATAAGIAVTWTGADEVERTLDEDILLGLLDGLGYPAADAGQRRESAERLGAEADAAPGLLIGDAGQALDLHATIARDRRPVLRDERGHLHESVFDEHGRLRLPRQPGYYDIECGEHTLALAVAPPRCPAVGELLHEAGARAFGLSAQVPSLRRAGDGGLGDAAAVAALARRAGADGADALALSPLHAVAPPRDGYSPYTPSHRAFLDPLLAAPALVLGEDAMRTALQRAGLAEGWAALETATLIDWPQVAALRNALLDALHADFAQADRALRRDFGDFERAGGEALRAHGLFAARQAQAAARGESLNWRDWQGWDAEPGHGAPAAFAARQTQAVDRQIFAQWLAARAWACAQTEARAAGMRLGLIADLAVGFDPGGSEAWRHRPWLLPGLTLGAPPDAFNAHGQAWGVAGYAPAALRQSGYRPFIDLLRANLAVGGGLRIDHILGLRRLWVMPQGATADRGGYLRYPLEDLLRLVALEAWRHRAIVIGEDLGTVPPELRATLAARGVLGIDVLLFARDAKGAFLPPSAWRAEAIATTGTHDLPPLAGWRCGRDLAWRARIDGQDHDAASAAQAARAHDVAALDARLAMLPLPTAPSTTPVGSAELAAIGLTARSPSPLMLLPMEDALGMQEAVNLPGTVDEHPNWRRRLPSIDGDGAFDALLSWLHRVRRDA